MRHGFLFAFYKVMNTNSFSNTVKMSFNIKCALIVTSLMLVTQVIHAQQCQSLFVTDFSDVLFRVKHSQTGVQAKVIDVDWSKSSQLVLFTEGQHKAVFSTQSGKKIELGNDKHIFSHDGDSVSVFSPTMKTLFTYKSPEMTKTVTAIAADYIVEIRGNFVIAQKKNIKGYFIFNLNKGEELHHVENATSYFVISDKNEIGFLTEPSIVGFSEKSGSVETLYLPSLASSIPSGVSGRLVQFDHLDRNFNNDSFFKVKTANEVVLVHKNDLAEHVVGADFVRAYDVDKEKNIYVIQTNHQITVYKNGKIEFVQKTESARDLRILAYSKEEAVYVTYDAQLQRMIFITPFGKNHSDFIIGPAADLTFFKPRLITPGTLIFKNKNGEFNYWHIGEKKQTSVAVNIATGLSQDGKFIAKYDEKMLSWVIAETINPYKK